MHRRPNATVIMKRSTKLLTISHGPGHSNRSASLTRLDHRSKILRLNTISDATCQLEGVYIDVRFMVTPSVRWPVDHRFRVAAGVPEGHQPPRFSGDVA